MLIEDQEPAEQHGARWAPLSLDRFSLLEQTVPTQESRLRGDCRKDCLLLPIRESLLWDTYARY